MTVEVAPTDALSEDLRALYAKHCADESPYRLLALASSMVGKIARIIEKDRKEPLTSLLLVVNENISLGYGQDAFQ